MLSLDGCASSHVPVQRRNCELKAASRTCCQVPRFSWSCTTSWPRCSTPCVHPARRPRRLKVSDVGNSHEAIPRVSSSTLMAGPTAESKPAVTKFELYSAVVIPFNMRLCQQIGNPSRAGRPGSDPIPRTRIIMPLDPLHSPRHRPSPDLHSTQGARA